MPRQKMSTARRGPVNGFAHGTRSMAILCADGQSPRGYVVTRRFAFAIPLIVVLALAAVPAYAGTASVSGYATPAGQVQSEVTPPPAPPAANPTPQVTARVPAPASTPRKAAPQGLPFTGLDLVLVFGAGVALLSMGLLMARLSRAPRTSID